MQLSDFLSFHVVCGLHCCSYTVIPGWTMSLTRAGEGEAAVTSFMAASTEQVLSVH